MKDLFSTASDKYARYRPAYPPALFEYLNTLVPATGAAWDCGTGNGQVAVELAKTFSAVYATDISAAQIAQAVPADNLFYSVQPAEQTSFEDRFFDLIVVAQAVHWFHFEPFYAEVRRTAKEGALLCLTGYGVIEVSAEIDLLIREFYEDVLGPYWDPERKYIDEGYQTLPFPFAEINAPVFTNRVQWSLEHLIGYLNTWSAVKHFIKANGYNPVPKLQPEIAARWGTEEFRKVRFPLLLRLGRV